MIFIFLMIFFIIIRKRFNKNISSIFLLLIIALVSLSSAIFNPREFHNFYHSTTYEEFIRSKYSELQSPIADYYIDKYKNVDKEKSDLFLTKAISADSSNENEKALRLYNRA